MSALEYSFLRHFKWHRSRIRYRYITPTRRYNTRALVPETLVEGGRFRVIRERPSHEEMIAVDRALDHDGV